MITGPRGLPAGRTPAEGDARRKEMARHIDSVWLPFLMHPETGRIGTNQIAPWCETDIETQILWANELNLEIVPCLILNDPGDWLPGNRDGTGYQTHDPDGPYPWGLGGGWPYEKHARGIERALEDTERLLTRAKVRYAGYGNELDGQIKPEHYARLTKPFWSVFVPWAQRLDWTPIIGCTGTEDGSLAQYMAMDLVGPLVVIGIGVNHEPRSSFKRIFKRLTDIDPDVRIGVNEDSLGQLRLQGGNVENHASRFQEADKLGAEFKFDIMAWWGERWGRTRGRKKNTRLNGIEGPKGEWRDDYARELSWWSGKPYNPPIVVEPEPPVVDPPDGAEPDPLPPDQPNPGSISAHLKRIKRRQAQINEHIESPGVISVHTAATVLVADAALEKL